MKNLIFCIFMLSAIGQHLQAQTLSACYDFDNGSIRDNITGNVGASARCSNVPDRFGNPDKAIYLPCSTTGIVNLGAGANLKPMNGTIAMWVYKPGECRQGGGETLLNVPYSVWGAGYKTYGIGYAFDLNYARGSTMNASWFSNTPTTMPLNSWHHLVLTFDDTSNVFYQDGVESYHASILSPIVYSPTDNVLMGWEQSSHSATDTYFDDLRIYNGAMTAAQVAALYQSTATCAAVGITEAESSGSLRILPNPNTGQFSVEQPTGKALVAYKLYDLTGRLLHAKEGLSEVTSLNFGELAAGTYLLELADETGTVYRQKLAIVK